MLTSTADIRYEAPAFELMDHSSLLRRLGRVDPTLLLPRERHTILIPAEYVPNVHASSQLERLQTLVLLQHLRVEDQTVYDLLEVGCRGMAQAEASSLRLAVGALIAEPRVKTIVAPRAAIPEMLRLVPVFDRVTRLDFRMMGFAGTYAGRMVQTVGATAEYDPIPQGVLYGLGGEYRYRTRSEVGKADAQCFRFYHQIAADAASVFCLKYRYA